MYTTHVHRFPKPTQPWRVSTQWPRRENPQRPFIFFLVSVYHLHNKKFLDIDSHQLIVDLLKLKPVVTSTFNNGWTKKKIKNLFWCVGWSKKIKNESEEGPSLFLSLCLYTSFGFFLFLIQFIQVRWWFGPTTGLWQGNRAFQVLYPC